METIEECEEYLLNIPKFKKKTLLSDTAKFYELLGSPGKKIRKIHVAGTNGKGSTCFYTSGILQSHGLKTGLFTSPHLVTMRERFVANGRMIDEKSFVKAFNTVLTKCETFDEESKNKMHPSFFEFLFLMFMVWVDSLDLDVLILETGLGGRLDATNIFDGNEDDVNVICSVSRDHMAELGDTLEQIAFEKAGIIKKDALTVSFANGSKVDDVVKKKADLMSSKLYFLKEEMISDVSSSKEGISFDFAYDCDEDLSIDRMHISLPTTALYQRFNASMAILVSKLILKGSFESVKCQDALAEGSFAGRLEEIAPSVYVDGAHNEGAVLRLLETVKEIPGRKVLIFGACKDKEYMKMLGMICKSGVFDKIYLTEINSYRSASVSELNEAVKFETNVISTESLKDAVCIATEENCTVYIAGSLYLVGEAKDLFGGKNSDRF